MNLMQGINCRVNQRKRKNSEKQRSTCFRASHSEDNGSSSDGGTELDAAARAFVTVNLLKNGCKNPKVANRLRVRWKTWPGGR